MLKKLAIYAILIVGIIISLKFYLQADKEDTGQSNEKLELALSQAGPNRPEIERFLSLYKKPEDSLKFRAAKHLIENLMYHEYQDESKNIDPNLSKKIHLADSLYYQAVKGKSSNEINGMSMADSIAKFSKYINSLNLTITDLDGKKANPEATAIENISYETLRQQLERSFELRENSPLVSKMSFTDFCEYIVPFQARFGKSIRKSSKELSDFISKYIIPNGHLDITEAAKLYRLAIYNLRYILGDYPLKRRVGYEEVFFTNVPDWNCFDISNYAAAFFNAAGIPTATEYNMAFKMLPGRHSLCAILDDAGHYTIFSPEGFDYFPQQMSEKFEKYDGWMNLYRIHYAPQTDAPHFLKSNHEFVPTELANPFIEDVTSKRMETISLELPFKAETHNNLAYLASFNSQEEMVPITWAKINKDKETANFLNVIPNRLYFPIYYKGNSIEVFGKPFMMIKDNSVKNGYVKREYNDFPTPSNNEVIVSRKFPRKEHMIEIAQNLRGTILAGSNDPSFNKMDTLYTLDFELQPRFQEIALKNEKPYKFYRIIAPKENPYLFLSEIQFLTKASFNYSNVTKPSPLHVLAPSEIKAEDPNTVRLLAEGLDKISGLPEYDESMETAPGSSPWVALNLKEKQIVTKIRIAPINANNGILVNDKYLLLVYDKGSWMPVEEQIAKYNYLKFKNLCTGALYWVKNLTRGKEEIPFTIDRFGKQNFIYESARDPT